MGKAPPTAAEFGRCIHLSMDSWYEDKDDVKAVDVFLKSFVENPTDDKRTLAVGKKLLQLYFDKYREQNIKVLASELEFKVKLPYADYYLIGRIDKIIDWSGIICVMDHKTTTRLGHEFFYMIKPNAQFDGYIWAARQLGYPTCSTIMLDAILVAKGLTTPAQLQKLTPQARDVSERTEADFKRYFITVSEVLPELEGCYMSNTWAETGAFTNACCNFIECPYRKICREDASLHEQIIAQDYKVEHWNPSDYHKKKEVVSG